MKIKWNFFKPHYGKDEEGNNYLRVGHWTGLIWPYVFIILFITAIWFIGWYLNT